MGPWDPAPSGPEAPGPEPKRRGSRVWGRVLVGVALIALVAALAVYLAGAKFSIRVVSTSDDHMDVELIEPIPPPVAQPPPAPPPAPAPTIGPNGELLRHPEWVRRPAPDFPGLAWRRGVDRGDVVLRCETLATGEFGACEVLGESPTGAGFAEAALASTRQARVRPHSIDGFETDSDVTFTVRFRMAPEP
jgi:protein TonB